MAKQNKGFAETIPPQVMKKLRNAVAPPGKRGTWLRYLDDNRLAEVFVQLQAGTAAHHIASIAQKEWGIKPESKTESLARAVRGFKDKVVGELARLPVRKSHPEDAEAKENLTKQAKKVSDKIQELEELGWSLLEQRKRIELLRSKEDVAKMAFSATDNAIRVFKDLIESYAKLKVELGMIEPPQSEFNLNVKHQFDGLMQHTVGPDGEKVVSALDRFCELIDERALTLEQNTDGTFSYKERPNALTNECKAVTAKGNSD